MFTTSPPTADLSDAWIEGDPAARWRSSAGHGPGEGAKASGSSVLEVDAGCRLPRHTDSAEETIVVVSGTASVTVGEEVAEVSAGGVALVPECVPHDVRNAGDETLRFVAVYAGTEVTTTYEDDVRPDGGRERDPIG
ncbi:MAG TPA: cupin domain-containing protein [Thermoleophilaceae bacterium]|jgi:quercetin dioxygenase-like cupin family protein